jgi:DNA-binding response OmpR family regulator
MLATSPITSMSITTTPATILAGSSGSTSNVKPIVLLVEDDNYVSAAIWTLLQDSNFDVIIAASAAEGFKMVKTILPDIVVLDVNLPDMSGVEIYRHLKTDPRTADLPVVFFSAHSQFAEEALDLGARAFLVKPNDIVRLADCLTQILAPRAAARLPQNLAQAVPH